MLSMYSKLKVLLRRLDHQLNLDKPLKDIYHTSENARIKSVMWWALRSHNEMYYLSDGGYSRVFFDEEIGRVRLATESRKEVKAEWDKKHVQVVRREIEEHVGEELLKAEQQEK
jgi:hypothetical protein